MSRLSPAPGGICQFNGQSIFNLLNMTGELPHFIYITGCDGTGKTTQARLLIDELEARGIKTQHVWLRFAFLFSVPLLVYARLCGYSWYEVADGVRHGYWDFQRSWLLRSCLPWLILVDAALAAIGKILIPIWGGKTIVCERFVLDMLADLIVACGNPRLHLHPPGSLYLRLLPSGTRIFMLDLDIHAIRNRRKDLMGDKRLETRLDIYRLLANDLSIPFYSSQIAPDDLSVLINQTLNGQNENYFGEKL